MVALGSIACGETFEAPVELDERIPVSGFGAVLLDLPASARIRGGSGGDIRIQGTLTLVSANAAQVESLAETYAVETASTSEPLRVVLPAPGAGQGTPFPEVRIFGELLVEVPAAMDLAVLQRGGSVQVSGVDGQMDIESVGTLVVQGLRSTGRLQAASGGARVDAILASGDAVQITCGQGPVNVVLPPNPSVRIEAMAGPGREVVVSHPDLPRSVGRETYQATVGSGAARVLARSFSDNVVLLR